MGVGAISKYLVLGTTFLYFGILSLAMIFLVEYITSSWAQGMLRGVGTGTATTGSDWFFQSLCCRGFTVGESSPLHTSPSEQHNNGLNKHNHHSFFAVLSFYQFC